MCLGRIEETGPGLGALHREAITEQAGRAWVAGLRDKLSSHSFNNLIGTLRLVIAAGIKAHRAPGGGAANPRARLGLVRVKQKELRLPEPLQFRELVANLRAKSAGYGERVGDRVESLADSGMRIPSEAAWVVWENLDWRRSEILVRGDPHTATKTATCAADSGPGRAVREDEGKTRTGFAEEDSPG